MKARYFSPPGYETGARVLDLCCGDGFNDYHFYAIRAGEVTAVDFDEDAIRAARRNFVKDNIHYIHGDIRFDIPEGPFDNIVWDAAIEHFTKREIESLMRTIKNRLAPEGILSGYTIVEKEDGTRSHSDHEYEFRSKEDLLGFLTPHFASVKVFETVYPTRHNLYFYATETGVLPFDVQWTCLHSQKM